MPDPGQPLRVCYLVSYFHPFESGAERQALAQGTELVRRGHSVVVATHWVPGVARFEDVRGIAVHRCIDSSNRGPLFAPTFVASAVRALRRLRPHFDLVHTHQALWEAVASGVARKGLLQGAPTIVQPASSGYYGEAEELSRIRGASFWRRLILQNDAFVAISADIERQWLALGVDPRVMHRIPSGVDARQFAPGPSLVEKELPPRPRVIFTGRLHPQKNLDVLIDAWPSVVAGLKAHLVLVGHGPERERLEAKVQNLGVREFVHFLGAVADPSEHLRAGDLFVLPSVAEGMSNSLLEAMATGLPCIASDIGGNQDLLCPDENGNEVGILVPPDSSDRWSAAIRGLLANPERHRILGERSRRRIESEYALEIVIDCYVALYRKLLGQGQGGDAERVT
jgi:glycosyltransferase involved in cell wall biosynthesis